MRLEIKSSLSAEGVSLKLDHQTLDDIGKVVEAGILKNIQGQRQADGSALKQNAPSTRRLKERLGLPILSLVFKEHRFVKGGGQSFTHTVEASRGAVTIRPANAEIAELSESLQHRGYTGWFGISRNTSAAIKARIRKFIEAQLGKIKAKRK